MGGGGGGGESKRAELSACKNNSDHNLQVETPRQFCLPGGKILFGFSQAKGTASVILILFLFLSCF